MVHSGNSLRDQKEVYMKYLVHTSGFDRHLFETYREAINYINSLPFADFIKKSYSVEEVSD